MRSSCPNFFLRKFVSLTIVKEVIVRYRDSRVLTLLKTLSRIFDFSISESDLSKKSKEKFTFTVLHVDNKGYTFNRDEANER